MKVAPNLNFTVIEPTKKSLEQFVQMLKTVYQNFVTAVNGQIGFGDGTNLDNINGSWINVVAPVAPNTDFTINHNLNRIPSGYWAMTKDRACDIYTGSVVATTTQITLRATVASAVLRLFIIGVLLCLYPLYSFAQGASHTNTAQKSTTVSGSSGIGGGTVLQAINGAVITVCNGSTLPVAGSTCTGLASIFSNVTLTSTLSNPFNADVNGNYTFYATSGQNYVVSVGGTGLVTYSYVWTAPPSLSGNLAFTGNNTILPSSTGNIAARPASADAVRYVSASGNDSNDGLSMGTAKATIGGAYTTLPNCSPIPGTYGNAVPLVFTAPCGTIYLAENPSGYTVSTGITINGLLVRIIGMGKLPVAIKCIGSITCFTFNNQSPFAIFPVMSSDGGIYNITIGGDGSGATSGSANQILLLSIDAAGIAVHDVRFMNANGASSIGWELLNSSVGGIHERTDLYNVGFDNNTTGMLVTTAGSGTPSPSFGHMNWHNIQWSINNNQTALAVSGIAGIYASNIEGVVNSADPNVGHTGTAIALSGSGSIKGEFRVSIDNGGGMTIAVCTGCTSSNFQTWGYAFTNPGWLTARDDGIFIDQHTPILLGTGLIFQVNGATQWQIANQSPGQLNFTNANNFLNVSLAQANGGGLILWGSTSGGVSIVPAAVAGGTQTVPNITGNFLMDAGTQTVTGQKNFTGGLLANGVSVAGLFTFTNVTPVTANTNTAADQNGMVITVTAGALNSVNRTLLVQLAGVYSTPAASTSVITDKLKLCTVSGCGSGTVVTLATWTTTALGGIQATNDPYNLVLNSTTQTAGASAAFEAHGNLTIDLAALSTAAESVFADGNTATVGTIDSTAQLFLQHTRAFSNASASNSFTDRQMIADTVD